MTHRFHMPAPERNPLERWQRLADLTRLVVVSTRVRNIAAPLSLVFVGPPGDGKTEMLLRADNLAHVMVLTDASYMGFLHFAGMVRDKEKSAVIIPDLGSIVGRKSEVARQAIATMASIAAEGLRTTAVGKIIRDFRGAQGSILTAITPREFEIHSMILGQNAFLSRCFVCDFDLEMTELEPMLRRHMAGKRELLAPLWANGTAKRTKGKAVVLPQRVIEIPQAFDNLTVEWWKQLHIARPDMFYGFRSGHALRTLLQAAAYLRGASRVTREDVALVERVLPLVFAQVQLKRETT